MVILLHKVRLPIVPASLDLEPILFETNIFYKCTANKQTATNVTVTPSASANIAVGLGHATPTLSAIPSGNRTVLPPALAASVDEVPVSIGYVNGASTSASPSDSSALLPTAVPVNENGRTLSSSSSSSKSSITYLTGASTSTVSASGGSGLSSILSMLKSVDTQTLHLSSTSSSATRPTSGISSSITHPTSSTTSKAAVVHVEVSSEYTSTMSSSSGSMEPSKSGIVFICKHCVGLIRILPNL